MFLNNNFASGEYWISLIYSIPAILIALCFHEFAHAYSAYKLGDPTAKMKGRLTIDPTKHLDVFGTIAMILCGFGWAKPVPVDSRNFKKPLRDNIIVSVSGVLMNLFIAFISYAIYFIVVYSFGYNEIFVNIIIPVILYNTYIAVFNIIPIPPLDGFNIIGVLFIRKAGKAVRFLYKYGFIILIVLVITGALSSFIQIISDPIIAAYGAFFSLFL